jgi:hypothetical protein
MRVHMALFKVLAANLNLQHEPQCNCVNADGMHVTSSSTPSATPLERVYNPGTFNRMCPTMDANNTLSDNAHPEIATKMPPWHLVSEQCNASGGRTAFPLLSETDIRLHVLLRIGPRYNRTSKRNPSLLTWHRRIQRLLSTFRNC